MIQELLLQADETGFFEVTYKEDENIYSIDFPTYAEMDTWLCNNASITVKAIKIHATIE